MADLKHFVENCDPVSRIRDERLCSAIEQLTGYRPVLTRAPITLEAGDFAMVV